MIIDSKRILLRSWKEEDIEDLVEGLNNINVSKWLANIPYPYTKQDAKDFIEYSNMTNENNIMLAIGFKGKW